jgi:3-deoxy-D-manno-octulosonic-acid transferase
MLLDLFYAIAGILLIPYFLYRRFVKGKRGAGLGRKLGQVAQRDPKTPRIWIHAVSVGEAAAAETLVKAFRQAMPQADIVVSTTTVTGQEIAAKKYGAQNVFFYPLDFSFAVRRALDRLRPNVLLLMELEVWPNMTAECERRGIPIVVSNGRITERAAARYRRFWFLVAGSFRRVQRWLVQSDEYAARLKTLGVDAARVEIAGNIKYDAIDTTLSPDEKVVLRAKYGLPADAPVLVGGSTHPSEEPDLLHAVKFLRKGGNANLRLVLVPRHPERAGDVAKEINATGFTCLRLSVALKDGTWPMLTPDTVLLVDVVGVLKEIYKLADAAFVGGSLIPHGGQNIMEPCGLGVPTLHGPHMHNFNDAMEILRGCNGAMEVSRDSLSAELRAVFSDLPAARKMAARARNAFLERQGATGRTVEYVKTLMR